VPPADHLLPAPESAGITLAVQQGERFTITVHGKPVAAGFVNEGRL
jgi:hypothetical protein